MEQLETKRQVRFKLDVKLFVCLLFHFWVVFRMLSFFIFLKIIHPLEGNTLEIWWTSMLAKLLSVWDGFFCIWYFCFEAPQPTSRATTRCQNHARKGHRKAMPWKWTDRMSLSERTETPLYNDIFLSLSLYICIIYLIYIYNYIYLCVCVLVECLQTFEGFQFQLFSLNGFVVGGLQVGDLFSANSNNKCSQVANQCIRIELSCITLCARCALPVFSFEQKVIL